MVIDAEKLRNKMIQKGYTTKTLANAAHLSVQTVQNILQNKTFEPQGKTVFKLTQALNCLYSDVA
ncbi:MAG: helix-turn-helix transcriptional regulator [Selenomonadaceae bacterium]|nr:helix-turn-helix transcriptional regulator [Selenomonadaceae bacterium]